MKYKNMIIVIIAMLLLFTACKPITIPEYQIVIETIPNHLYDMIHVMQVRNGVFVFDPDTFGTAGDTYILISHSNSDNLMVDIENMEISDNKELIISLRETTASMPRNYTVIKLLDYTGKVAINNADGKWPSLNTDDLSFTSLGVFENFKKSEVKINIEDYTVKMNLDASVKQKLESQNASVAVDDTVLVNYAFNSNELYATDFTKIASSNTVAAKFVAYVDPHTIEVIIDDQHKAFQLSTVAQIWIDNNKPKTNTILNFDYYITTEGAAVITKFSTPE